MSTYWCRGFGAAPWECRYFPLSPVFVGLKCAQASRVSVYLSALIFLSVVFIDFFASLLFCFLDKAGVFVGSSIVVPPVFPFFSPCLPCPFVFLCFSPFFSSFFLLLHLSRVHSCWGFVCTFSSFIDFPFIFWRVFCERSFSPFLTLIFALGAKVSKCISESYGHSGYIPCSIGKDGGFIRRDRSFHLPRINLAKDGRCVTDTLSKRFMSVWVSTG